MANEKRQVLIQTGKGKSSYKTRYSFKLTHAQMGRAFLYYNSINTHSGYKKRLLVDGVVKERYIS